MKDVHEDDVTHWIREYNIVDHMASHEQITSLKLNRAIPPELGSCGLMTKTNAERLVGALIDPNNYRILPADKRDKFDPILVGFKVLNNIR
uniref:SKI/SNO/DAC domain-containing protein n=1 Tax=Panagrolaimus davidi TaxID=227884 RepID=A0A914PUR0_9BILA